MYRHSDIWYVIKELFLWLDKETRGEYVRQFGRKQLLYDLSTGIFDIFWSALILVLYIPGAAIYCIGAVVGGVLTAIPSALYKALHRVSRKFWLKRAKHKNRVNREYAASREYREGNAR